MKENKTLHFLIVDDDEIDREAIKRAFQKEKISNPVIESENGAEALDFLRSKDHDYFKENPIIILLDLNMPKMGGIEFLKELRKDPDLNRIIVFVMTTSNDDEDIINAYNLNIAGYIVKGKIDISKTLVMIDSFWKIVEMPPY